MTNYKNEEEEEEDASDHFDQDYLQHKLNKCKSQDHLKNIHKKTAGKKVQKQGKTLVTHAPIPKHYNKARNAAERKLTKQIKNVTNSRTAIGKENFNNFGSPAGKEHIERKKRQIQYYTTISKQNGGGKKANSQSYMTNTPQQNMQKLKKLLKWKEHNLKKQQQEVQQGLEMKVQLKKEAYVKKMYIIFYLVIN